MRTRKERYKTIAIKILICLLFVCSLRMTTLRANETPSICGNSVYCWYESDLADPGPVIARLGQLQVTDLYLNMSAPEDHAELLGRLEEGGIVTYDLKGQPEWYVEPEAVTERIDELYAYNEAHESGKIAGITLDIEPYVMDEFNEAPIWGMERLADTFETIYAYAGEKGLKVVLAIPYWYDEYTTSEEYTAKERERAAEAFAKIVKNCDRISVMNYTRSNMTKHIKEEIELAEKFGKEIESAAEFSAHPKKEQPWEDTFYYEKDPLTAAYSAWKEIRAEYPYGKLRFAYHHLGMLLEIDQRPKESGTEDSDAGHKAQNDDPSGQADRIGTILTGENLRYRLGDNCEAVCIGVADENVHSVSIPDNIRVNGKEYTVTKIGASAFAGKKKLSTIVIGKKITVIGKNAFKNCISLKSITIPSKVIRIEANAFYGCKGLKKIKIRIGEPKTIGRQAFKGIARKAVFRLKGTAKAKKSLKKALQKKRTGYVKSWKIR